MPQLKIFTPNDLQQMVQVRPYETKLGERLIVGDYHREEAEFVVLGIPEDIGVRANLGIGGAHTAWPGFLKAFLNLQSTASLSGTNICLLGYLDCSDLMAASINFSTAELRKAVVIIDQNVEAIVFEIIAAGKFPILIGGGHNNAYPIIKGVARGYTAIESIPEAKLNCINLDAHTDFRPQEGRHSGNGFRYAFEEGYLDRYAMIGLHRNYNAQAILDEIAVEERIHYNFWERIFLEDRLSFDEAIRQALSFTNKRPCGIELDLDCIENTLSSAMTPSGISANLARRFIHQVAAQAGLAYLHLCEGAVQLADGRKDSTTGKLIAYLVSDFIRGKQSF